MRINLGTYFTCFNVQGEVAMGHFHGPFGEKVILVMDFVVVSC